MFFILLFLAVSACKTSPEQKKADTSTMAVSEKIDEAKKEAQQSSKVPKDSTLHAIVDTARQKIPIRMLDNSKKNLDKVLKKIKQGDSTLIVCYGNSITNGYKVGTTTRVDNPYPEVLEKLLQKHFGNVLLKVINEGHNGWRSREAVQNLANLVIAQKPDLAIIKFGINDAYSSVSLASFEQNMRQVVDLLIQHNIAVLLLRTSPINTPYETAVSKYAPILLKIAQEKNLAFFDLHTALLKRLDKEKIMLNAFLPDDVHLADEYYPWIAEAIFEFLTKE